MDHPVTKCDREDVQVPWLHGRVARRLFRDEDTHTHIKYMSLKVMDKLTEETLTPLEANNVSLDVLHKISNEAPLKDFLQQFLFPSIPIEVLKSQAEVLHQLSGEYQIESVLPWRSFDMIKTICNKLDHNDDCTKELLEMRRYNTQISDLIALSVKNTCTQVLAPFFQIFD